MQGFGKYDIQFRIDLNFEIRISELFPYAPSNLINLM